MGNRNCSFCGSSNEAESTRCQLCGRRLSAGPALVPEHFGNTAPSLDLGEVEVPAPVHRKSGPTQTRLFPYQEPRKVLPFDRVSPQASTAGKKIIEKNARERALRRANERMGREQALANPAQLGQQVFSFPQAEAAQRRMEPVRCANFPVASPAARLQAAGFDFLLIFAAMALFGGVLYLGGAGWPEAAQDQYMCLGLSLAIVLFYFAVFAIAGGDTPGMRWASLQLVDLYGHPPSATQRVMRILGTVVALASLGIGLLWCLFDAEGLTWQDEISGTIPTPQQSPIRR